MFNSMICNWVIQIEQIKLKSNKDGFGAVVPPLTWNQEFMSSILTGKTLSTHLFPIISVPF